jgi:spermidine/putrescine transport system permease protein
MKKKTSVISKLYMTLIFLFLYAPIIVMMVFSFNSSSSTYQFDGFSTYWWNEMFHDNAAMDALKNTIVLAVATACVSTVLGILAAVGLFNSKNRLFL